MTTQSLIAQLDALRTPYIVLSSNGETTVLAESATTWLDVIATAWLNSELHAVATWAIYTYIERPVKRTARRIAMSGHWSY